MPKYRVLSIDGGGIRGLVTTILLQRIIQVPGLEHVLGGISFYSRRYLACRDTPQPHAYTFDGLRAIRGLFDIYSR